jgi:hypothetical protein
MTNSELIDLLNQAPPNTRVLGTFEGVFREIAVYQAPDGTVILDVDYADYSYRKQIQSGQMEPKV